MAKKAAVPAVGSVFGGGFYAASIELDGVKYALVISPKAEGEKLSLEYKKKKLSTADGTDLDDDGFYNSCQINSANYPAAQFCRQLQINGFNDWYLPSRDELMLIFMALGPNRKKTPELFKAGAAEAFEDRWYWSSTENASNVYYAWVVYFGGGNQSFFNKDDYYAVRAVRRVKL